MSSFTAAANSWAGATCFFSLLAVASVAFTRASIRSGSLSTALTRRWRGASLKGHCSRDIRSGSCSGPSILRMAKHQRRLILGRGRGLFVIEVDDGGGFRPATTVEVDAALRQRELFGAAEYPLPNVRPVWVVMVPDNAQDLGPLRGIGRSVKAHTIRRHHTARPSGVTWSPCTAARLSPSLGASRFSSGLRTTCTRREGASP